MVIILPFLAGIPVISTSSYQIFVSNQMGYAFILGLNYVFTFALLLDLLGILVISLASVKHFSSHFSKKQFDFKNREMYIPLTGLLWVLLSFIWRIPFYLQGGFDLGFTRPIAWDLEDNQFYLNLLNNPLMLIIQLIAALSLFSFLFLQEKEISEPVTDLVISTDVGNFGIGRATIFGALNIIGVLGILFGSNIFLDQNALDAMALYGGRPNGIFLFMGIAVKVIIIPLFAIWTCTKFLGLQKISETAPPPDIGVKSVSKPSILEQI